MPNPSQLWAVVLAGGAGKRLEPLTRVLYGHAIPKQYAVVAGDRSLLAQTLTRVGQLVPTERTVVVATKSHEALAEAELRAFTGVKLVLQPQNLDTATGIWVGLAQVLARDPAARVLVTPSDHYVRDETRFIRALDELAFCGSVQGLALTLLGMKAQRPKSEYGWIVPGQQLCVARQVTPLPLFRVECFVEKPGRELASALWQDGALWNTLAFSGLAESCWRLCARHWPGAELAFTDYRRAIATAREDRSAHQVFATLVSTNFSTRILQQARNQLGVLACEDVGWSDIGTPRRVFEALAGTPEAVMLERRLSARGEHDFLANNAQIASR
jgi:mannose-1-phosphate guanylyltransferase